MKRNLRQEEIIKIIEQHEVGTQEELTSVLNAKGFKTTQATVSRDIKELGLVKVAGKEKKFKYSLSLKSEIKDSKSAGIFKESVISIETSLNIIVIKTLVGSANGAAYYLDKLNIPDILGTVSGDDTILMVAKAPDCVEKITEIIKEHLK